MIDKPLHPLQSKLLQLLTANTDDPLTIRELQQKVAASSPSVIAHHILQLEKKGYIKKNPYNPRDYRIIQGEPEVGLAYLNLYGMAACGPEGSILEGNPLERIPIPRRLLSFSAAHAFMVKAKGKSMEPKIYEGDWVIARKTNEAQDGKVFVCINNSECLIKRVRMFGDTTLLESFNPNVSTFQAADDFRVEGEVTKIISGRI